MKSFFTAFFLATMATTSLAHMEMTDPIPLRSKLNKNSPNPDYSMTSPLDKSGSDFACKGFLSDIGTDAGKSVATWAAGSEQKFTITGGASHNGGSCQASLSTDGGKTFKVIHSYIGNCPLVPDYKFTVPADTPAGEAVFAWTWFNKVGNREMYMNCAVVTIEAGSGSPAATAFSARPDMFVANAGNGCTTLESTDLKFPDPGPDVTEDSEGTSDPVGSCGSSGGGGGGGGGGGSENGNTGATPPNSVVTSQAPTTSTIPTSSNVAQQLGSTNNANPNLGTVNNPDPHLGTTNTPKDPKTSSGTPLTPSTNGECGDKQTCSGSGFGQCCSKYGYCGVTAEHCGNGCNPAYGTCGASAPGASSGSAKATGKLALAVSNVVATEPEGGKMVTKTETEIVYSTVYVTGRAVATGVQAKVNDIGGRSTFQTVTRGVLEPSSVIRVIPVARN